MIKKDLNLFAAYKTGSSKSGANDSKTILSIIMSFVFIICIAYITVSVIKINKQSEIKAINNEMQRLPGVETISDLPTKNRYNNLLNLYLNALKSAKDSFDNSVFIDSNLLREINSSMPADFKITNMKINSQTYVISGFCTNILSPATFKQSLDAKGIFSAINYSGVSRDSSGNYYFTITCVFKGADSK
ncbi:MAG: PilN domain-containing protein [Acutalibacteraceae bacterium]|jgi:hypothetical protein